MNVIDKISWNIITDSDDGRSEYPSNRTQLFMMLLASASNKKLNYMLPTGEVEKCVYRRSADDTYTYTDSILLWKEKYGSKDMICIAYWEEEHPLGEDDVKEYNKDTVEDYQKFCWMIEAEDANAICAMMLEIDEMISKPYDNLFRYLSSCGLNDFEKYL